MTSRANLLYSAVAEESYTHLHQRQMISYKNIICESWLRVACIRLFTLFYKRITCKTIVISAESPARSPSLLKFRDGRAPLIGKRNHGLLRPGTTYTISYAAQSQSRPIIEIWWRANGRYMNARWWFMHRRSICGLIPPQIIYNAKSDLHRTIAHAVCVFYRRCRRILIFIWHTYYLRRNINMGVRAESVR